MILQLCLSTLGQKILSTIRISKSSTNFKKRWPLPERPCHFPISLHELLRAEAEVSSLPLSIAISGPMKAANWTGYLGKGFSSAATPEDFFSYQPGPMDTEVRQGDTLMLGVSITRESTICTGVKMYTHHLYTSLQLIALFVHKVGMFHTISQGDVSTIPEAE